MRKIICSSVFVLCALQITGQPVEQISTSTFKDRYYPINAEPVQPPFIGLKRSIKDNDEIRIFIYNSPLDTRIDFKLSGVSVYTSPSYQFDWQKKEISESLQIYLSDCIDQFLNRKIAPIYSEFYRVAGYINMEPQTTIGVCWMRKNKIKSRCLFNAGYLDNEGYIWFYNSIYKYEVKFSEFLQTMLRL